MVIGDIMKRDIRYIIRKILIGVGTILLLSLINSCQVNASSVTPTWNGYQTQHCDLDVSNCALGWYSKMSNTSIGGINFQVASQVPAGVSGVKFFSSYHGFDKQYLLSGYFSGPQDTELKVLTDNGSCSVSNLFDDTVVYNIRRFDCLMDGQFDYIYISFMARDVPIDVYIGNRFYVNEIGTDLSGVINAINNANNSISSHIDNVNSGLAGHIDSNAANIITNLQEIIRKNDTLNNSINSNTQQVEEANKNINKVNDTIKDSDTSDASNSANSFFTGFETSDYGLTSIITAPLNLIKSITSSTCTPIGFEVPFVKQQATLPCMSAIYKEFFGDFLKIYQTITFGLVAYWVCVKIFFMVKGFKDPDSDRIEVLDL